tara:strand:- start:2272 stop:3939 length:1668 start_codon:yes stop_codon:yes gene_type:complete
MQIIIPMSGFGERFRKVGYEVPKPLIEVEGRPIISHVIDMFPGEKNFIFICNEDHLKNPKFKMAETLTHYAPHSKILSIKSHKLGPVHAVLQAKKHIKLDKEVIVNYCDFTCYWNWDNFKNFVIKKNFDGCIPSYKGFHPHSLGNTNYAYLKERKGRVYDIQEKKPYTNNRMEEYASSGTYYFKNGKILLDSLEYCIEEKLKTGSEYYISLAYKYLFEKKLKVGVYSLQHFMQWGTPEDLNEYCTWSEIFNEFLKEKINNSEPKGSIIIPMAGLGKRFADEGYNQTKPLIPVSGEPMAIRAVQDLPKSKYHSFILRRETSNYKLIVENLKEEFQNSTFKTIDYLTDGQASTALLGVEELKDKYSSIEGPITFGACDNGAIYNRNSLRKLMNDNSIDIIVWGYRGNPNAIRNPQMFGWVEEKNNIVQKISVKSPLKNTSSDPIVTGTFTFKNSEIYFESVNRLYDRKGKVNGEYYIDACINDAISLGYNCVLFEVDYYLSWGTPNDLKTFEYWQSCFHKWNTHPYTLFKDRNISESSSKYLDKIYSNFRDNEKFEN